MLKPRVAIITGGDSPEAPGSYTTAQHVFDQLDSAQYRRCLVELVDGHWRLMSADGFSRDQVEQAEFDFSVFGFNIPGSAEMLRFDCALIAIHGYPGETGQLQAYLDCVAVPYAGSRVLASSLAMNKYLCKSVVRGAVEADVPGDYLLAAYEGNETDLLEQQFGYPLIVKPNSAGSGVGVSKVFDRTGLEAAIRQIEKLGDAALVEEHIIGQEVTVGVVQTGGKTTVLPVAEVFRPAEGPQTASGAKTVQFTSRQNAELVVPADLQPEICNSLGKLATDIGATVGCVGCYRVDFIIREDGRIFFLEVNTIPGMAEASVLTRQVEAAGMQLSDVIDEMLANADYSVLR